MKRIIPALLVLSILLGLGGCGIDSYGNQVSFYYPRAEYQYNSADSILAPEARDTDGVSIQSQLLQTYFQGPLDPAFTNPFPAGLKLVSVYTDSTAVYITVSDEMAKLSGAPLIIACASLGKTAMAMSRTSEAQIQCQSLLLDGKKTLVISDETVMYLDNTPAENTTEDQNS